MDIQENQKTEQSSPVPENPRGLTSGEVQERVAQGKTNQVEDGSGGFIHDRDGDTTGGGVSHVHQALGGEYGHGGGAYQFHQRFHIVLDHQVPGRKILLTNINPISGVSCGDQADVLQISKCDRFFFCQRMIWQKGNAQAVFNQALAIQIAVLRQIRQNDQLIMVITQIITRFRD